MASAERATRFIAGTLFASAALVAGLGVRERIEGARHEEARRRIRELGSVVASRLSDRAACSSAITRHGQRFDWEKARSSDGGTGMPVVLEWMEPVPVRIAAGAPLPGTGLQIRRASLTDALPLGTSPARGEAYFFAQLTLEVGDVPGETRVALLIPVVDTVTGAITGCADYDRERVTRCARKSRIYLPPGVVFPFEGYGGRDEDGCVARGAVLGPPARKR